VAIWDDVVPAEDLARLRRYDEGRSELRRPGERPALLVIDMSLRFTTDRYTAGSSAVAGAVIRHLQPLLAQARASRIPVIYSTTTPRVTRAQQGQWGPSTEANGAADPEASRIHPEVEPVPGEEVVWKIPPSAFLHTDLPSLLTHYQADTVIVTGLVTSGCVRATAVDAFSHNYAVLVPEECCGDRSQVSHKVNLFDLHYKYATVQPVAETLAYLRGVAPNPRKG
jgi:maleamate amidohydrolase